jgi:hypothetical protein
VLLADAGDSTLPTDIIDGGNTSTPPTDIYDSSFLMTAQVLSGVITPVYGAVSTSEVINRAKGQVLYVNVGGTSTTVTMQVPGQQPYTGIDRDDLVAAGISNTTKIFALPTTILVDSTDSIVVLYSQSTAVTSALVQVV